MSTKLLIPIIALTMFASCDEIAKLIEFDLDYDSSVVIPSSTVISLPISLQTPSIQTNSASTFESNGTRADLVDKIRLSSMNLTITSPTDGDFGFLEEIELYISADGQTERLIASATDIGENVGKTITLDTEDTNLKAYIVQDDFQLRFSTVTDETIEQDHHIDIRSVFTVSAKLF